MNSDGSDPRRLTEHTDIDIGPSWSPDGSQIAFSSDRDDTLRIYVMDVAIEIVDTEPTFSGTVADRTITVGEMASLTLPAASDGDGELTYSLPAEDLPPGLAFDAASRTLSGTPTVVGDYALTYRVEDSDGDTDERTFTVTVEAVAIEEPIVNREPTFSGTVADRTITVGEMASLTLPAASDGDGELTYSLPAEDLPPGLVFDAASRTLSGTPTDAGDYALTYRVKDSDGDTDERTFTVTVEAVAIEEPIVNREPTFSGTVADRTITVGEEMASLTLPAASGGDGELTYSLSPAVPGLTFTPADRTLSGTPTVVGDYVLTYRVEDSDGDETELSFVLTVEGLPGFEGMAELPGGASMEFVWIPAGTFLMGSPDAEEGRYPDEGPVHEVKISEGFYLGKYEVTQSQWRAVMGSNPSYHKDEGVDRPDHPVERVTWDEVQEFIRRLNEEAGEELYRLPTEAEWEYACRAGTQTPWSFGDDESQLTDYAWYRGNNSPDGTKKVGSKEPNAWGLHDMHGNVWEWVQDWYDEEYYSSKSDWVDPQGPTSGSSRVRRGGHFGHAHVGVRSAYRHLYLPENRSSIIGVRLLRMSGD